MLERLRFHRDPYRRRYPPPQYLQTINALNGKKQASTDYGLTKSLNIKDEIGRYWRMASDRWSDYQERRKRTDMEPGRVAIETWLRPLFEDILGYHDIALCPSVAIGSRHFPIGYNACASTGLQALLKVNIRLATTDYLSNGYDGL